MKAADVPDGPLVLDTDVLSWVLWSRERYKEYEALIDGHILAVGFATVGELRAGAINAGFGPKRMAALEERLRQLVILPANDAVTRSFGQLYARFRDRLKGGGVNDMWIAACALAQNPKSLPLVTGNLSDYQTIAGEFPLQIVHPDL